MKKLIYIITALSLLLIASGCTQTKEKTSDPKILLNEKENKLPPSILTVSDKNLEKKLLTDLPKLKNFKKLTKKINKTKNGFTLKKVIWTKYKTKIIVFPNSNTGIIWFTSHYKCTQYGFFTCKSGYTVDNIFKIKDKKTNKKYLLNSIDGHPRKIIKRYSSGKKYTVTRDKINTKANKYYPLVFKNVPLSTLRHFDLFEEYCTSDSTSWNVCNIRIKYFDEEIKEQKTILNFFKKYDLKFISIKVLENIYTKYNKYDEVKQLIAKNILYRIKQKNSIQELHNFNKKYSEHTQLLEESISKLYSLIKIKDSVAGYEWFIKNYSSSKYSKLALLRIHEIMYNKAKKLDTISAYNSFIFSYPTAKQVKDANYNAKQLEIQIYTNLGLLSFWDTDHKKEKKSRQLLIKAKQIERFPTDNDLRGNRKAGYSIVANRMYQLLQEEFNDSDATLRHLESQEFKDFVKSFKSIMKDIKYTLDKINNNTSNTSYYLEKLITISENGFNDAKADRAMAAYHVKKQTEWEKLMHFRDKGYQ